MVLLGIFCSVLWFLSSSGISVFGYPTMLLCNQENTEMVVEEIENPDGLPIVFLDSNRSDENFVNYVFAFDSKASLELEEIIVFNKKESKTFSRFEQKNNNIWVNDKGKESALLEGRGSMVLSAALDYNRVGKVEPFILKSLVDEKIYVVYKLRTSNIKVRYRFIDTETYYGRFAG